MMQHTKSGPLAMPSRYVIDRMPQGRTTVRTREYPALTRSSNGRRLLSAADVAAFPAHPADAAQAAAFARMLQAEMAELRRLATVMALPGTKASTDDSRLPKTLTEVTARIEEVHRLLKALRNRFPHGPLLGGPALRTVNSAT